MEWSFVRSVTLAPGRYAVDLRAADAAHRNQPLSSYPAGTFTIRS